MPRVSLNQTAPNFSLADYRGSVVSLADFRKELLALGDEINAASGQHP